MRGNKPVTTTLVAVLVAASLFAIATAIGGGSVAAIHPDDADDVSEHANFTVNFPYATDHYPGDQNHENGSIEYFAIGEDAFHEQGASDGLYYDWIIVHAEYDGEDWIDYSACDVDNTEAFGIDRGNNNSGTNYDDDLLQHRKDSDFRDDGIVIEFFDWEDPVEDPPYMAPEDAIVAAQGEGSAGGPCLTVTEEPGWYRIVSFANATVNDNHPDEQPTDDADYIRFQLQSNYLYVCDCDSEEEARDELGPPPSEQDDDVDEDDGEETPTPTESDDDDADDTDDPEETPTPTEADDDDAETDDDDAETDDDDAETDDDDDAEDGEAAVDTDDEGTPAADGPGFGAVAAIVALLASALLLHRRG